MNWTVALSPPSESEHVSDLSFEEGTKRHYIFLHVLVVSERNRITVVGVGYFVRPIELPAR